MMSEKESSRINETNKNSNFEYNHYDRDDHSHHSNYSDRSHSDHIDPENHKIEPYIENSTEEGLKRTSKKQNTSSTHSNEYDTEEGRSVQEMPPFPGQPMIEPVNSIGNQSEQELAFPEGGAKAWLCVLGSWASMLATFGMVNCGGPIQAYLVTHQLKNFTESEISWILSVYAFLFFFGGVQVGPIFDTYGLKPILIPGCIGSVLSTFFLSLSTEYYQFMLGYGVLGGLSASLIFTPAIASVGHFFYRKRGVATGMAATGGAFGGLIYPLAMEKMFSELSFGWTMRVIGFVNLALLILAVLTIRTRLPQNKARGASVDIKAFKDKRFLFCTLGAFMIEFGIFVPVNYLTVYSLKHGVSEQTSYRMVVFLSVGSVLGRFLPGWFADKYGRFNVMVITTMLCAISCLAVWLPANDNLGAIVSFSVLFGIFSGSGISLTPVCISQICKTEDYGKRYGTCYFVASIGVLVGLPIAGAILQRQNGSYQGLIIFSGLCYFIGSCLFVFARGIGGGWKLWKIY